MCNNTPIEHFVILQEQIKSLINAQKIVETFTDWEEWLEYHFNPINETYENCWIEILKDKNITDKPKYINFQFKVKNMIVDDCDMTLSNYD